MADRHWTLRSGRVIDCPREGMATVFLGHTTAFKDPVPVRDDVDDRTEAVFYDQDTPLTPDEKAEIAEAVCEDWRRWAGVDGPPTCVSKIYVGSAHENQLLNLYSDGAGNLGTLFVPKPHGERIARLLIPGCEPTPHDEHSSYWALPKKKETPP